MSAETILLISDYSMGYVGGAQSALRRQAGALVSEGVGCVLLAPGAPDTTGIDPRVQTLSPPVRFVLPGLGLPVLGRGDALEELVAEVIRAHRVTGVVIHSEFSLAAAAARAARKAGIPVLHTVHTFFWRAPGALSLFAPLVTAVHTRVTRLPRDPAYRGASAIVNALRGMTLRMALHADAVLSPSHHQAQALRAAGVGEVHAYSNVVVPAERTPLPSSEPLTLVWVARFAPEKRLHIALDAIRIVGEGLGPGRVHLHVAGGEKKPLPDVTFHGIVDGARVDELLAASHALVLTSLGFDNQPMVALEAFARGRTVIVSDPVLAEEFGGAALGAAASDAQGLAETILALVAEPAPLTEASAAATRYAAERSPAVLVQELLALLNHHRPTPS